MTAGILILAAGQSRRFGSDKRNALLPCGQPLLARSVERALASGLPVIVCLRVDDQALAQTLQSAGASTLFCPEADLGMGATLAYAITRISGWDSVLIALGDMPNIKPATFCKAATAIHPGQICQPTYKGTSGHPVGFSKHYFAEIARLGGDSGARKLIEKHEQALVCLPVDDPGILSDIDTPADLQ
ncbi:MAG: nucleotidyltransferase family protein [Halioglobus sp.]